MPYKNTECFPLLASGAINFYNSPQEGLCSSIGCPDGYTPITDAMNVECDDDPCEVSQCCEAFCSYHPCPNNFIPISGAGTTLCPDSGCTDDLCCGKPFRCFEMPYESRVVPTLLQELIETGRPRKLSPRTHSVLYIVLYNVNFMHNISGRH